MKKNFVTFVDAHDVPSFTTGRVLTAHIVRMQGRKKVSRFHRCTPASRRRMLRVLEAME